MYCSLIEWFLSDLWDVSLYVIRWSVVRNVFSESCLVGTLVPIYHGVTLVV